MAGWLQLAFAMFFCASLTLYGAGCFRLGTIVTTDVDNPLEFCPPPPPPPLPPRSIGSLFVLAFRQAFVVHHYSHRRAGKLVVKHVVC